MELKSFKPQLEAMKKKANQGDKEIALKLAIIYMRGDGVEPDVEEVARWGGIAFDQMTDEDLDDLSN
mgnify:CR=1 FL=1